MSTPPVSPSGLFGSSATIGKREVQEDAVGWSAPHGETGALPALTVIADGMGGHAAGEVASDIAVNGFLDAWRRGEHGGKTTLIEALDQANALISAHVAEHPETDGMGCTLIGVELDGKTAAYRWISVGDSLLLSVTETGVERLNADHSYREERERLIAAGESLDGAPAPNVLRSALMGFDVPLIDDRQDWRPFAPGETLILATDGIETLSDAQILEIVAANPGANAVAAALVMAVEAAGKPRQDNTTVAVLRPDADEAASPITAPMPPRATDDQPTLSVTADAAAAAKAGAGAAAVEAPTLPARPAVAPGAAASAAKRAPDIRIIVIVVAAVVLALLAILAFSGILSRKPATPDVAAPAAAPAAPEADTPEEAGLPEPDEAAATEGAQQPAERAEGSANAGGNAPANNSASNTGSGSRPGAAPRGEKSPAPQPRANRAPPAVTEPTVADPN
ncbi:serine/threonine protein phosphatase PrpC [Sphingomonas zeicaulis]|uniref:PP2C family protein-serine/threonine phosphatase n=1 Tax=Sphingomonas zeicaulis TaxID=1632740 RepID=UPI003D2205A1